MHCNSCDTVNDTNSKFCRLCGAALTADAPRYVISNAPVTGPLCPSCTRRNPNGARFCVYCATQLAPMAQPTYAVRSAVPAAVGTTHAPVPAFASGPTVVINNAVGIAHSAPRPITAQPTNHGNLLLRAIWFFLIGWWLGLIWTVVAWLFNLTLLGLPVGLMMLNAIPQVMTLRPRYTPILRIVRNGYQQAQHKVQQPLALRAIWFFLIGWWASLLWMLVAWSLCASILLMPIAFWMFDRVPTITTLAAE